MCYILTSWGYEEKEGEKSCVERCMNSCLQNKRKTELVLWNPRVREGRCRLSLCSNDVIRPSLSSLPIKTPCIIHIVDGHTIIGFRFKLDTLYHAGDISSTCLNFWEQLWKKNRGDNFTFFLILFKSRQIEPIESDYIIWSTTSVQNRCTDIWYTIQ